MNRSEAGKLGWQRSREKLQNRHLKFVAAYENNPKKCRLCDKIIPFVKRMNDYCSHSCSAAYNNGRRHSNLQPHPCLWCGKEINNRKIRVYCSHECRINFNLDKSFKKIKDGTYKRTWSGNPLLKKFLIKERGYRCEECGGETWRGKPIPLNVHHVDGDASNNYPDNIKLLCLNCHGITNNFGSKNRNKSTRKYRYDKDVKS